MTSSTANIFVYSGFFVFMGLLVWISNRHIRKSLRHARTSKKLLEIERDVLEKRVADRAGEAIASEKKYLQELECAARFGKLSRGLFHDLMCPLTSISLYLESLDTLKERPREYLDTIRKMVVVSRRMNSFMENVNSYIGTENMVRRSETVNIVKEIEVVRDIFSYKARAANVTITLDVPQSAVILADQIRIHQIVLNLISNAVESCEMDLKQTKSVVVSLKYKIDGVELAVSDTGCGISTKNLDRMFKIPFTTKKQGTGCGLMTIHSIVTNELGGTITVQSTEGNGTTIAVTIPHQPTCSLLTTQIDTHYPESSVLRSDMAEPHRE